MVGMSDTSVNSTRLAAVLTAIDEANTADPKQVPTDDGPLPAALVYGRRMSTELADLVPDAGEPLQIAVRGQHIERFRRPRDQYPMTREGYLAWRRDAARFHAERLTELMRDAGYDQPTIERVGQIVRKQNIKRDPDAQALEDCAALVFLRHELDDFICAHPEYDEQRMLRILRKTWKKMSPAGHDRALAIAFSDIAAPWIKKALAETETA